MTRAELEQRIADENEQLKKAGKYHSRDLRKHIHRMKAELQKYDHYQGMSRRAANG